MLRRIAFFWAMIVFSLEIQGQSISTGTISGSPFCGGASVSVPFTATGTFNSGNVFTAQLSDHKGSFANPTIIGTLAGTSSGTIAATLPMGAKSGTKYRIRVVSSSPAVTGSDNGKNLKINPKPKNTNATNITACSVTLTWNAQSNASSYKVRYKESGDDSYSDVVDVGNVTSYTFTGLKPNKNYEFHVRSVCANGEVSDWAKEKNVGTPAVAVPTGIVVYPGVAIATLDWNDMPCAASYRTRYRIIGTSTWSYKTSTASTVVLTGLWPATDYEAQVLTITATNDSSAYSALVQWNMDYRLGSSEVSMAALPNIVQDFIDLPVDGFSSSSTVAVAVVDVYGRVVYRSKLQAQAGVDLSIPVSVLASGCYVLYVSDGQRILHLPFVKP
ncbi:MAG: fibronectin type III domain-containing protein [Chitinophagales bacterium]|nr:fibronectin type III domain-containing protein [Chitinophagales bacterium]MDW8427450.1 fibronectin type III domain-containing protein [Chitinophagales bacterium]